MGRGIQEIKRFREKGGEDQDSGKGERIERSEGNEKKKTILRGGKSKFERSTIDVENVSSLSKAK
jgi:hypothetical protein